MLGNGRPVTVLYVDTGVGLAGGQYSLIEILKFLDGSRFRAIVCSPVASAIKVKCEQMGVMWLPLPFESTHIDSQRGSRMSSVVAGLWGFARGLFYIAGLIRTHGVDLVHANSFKAGLACGFGSLMTGKPLVFHDRVRLSHQPLDWLIGLRATRIIAVSRTVAGKHGWPLRRKVHVIASGIDTDLVTPREGRPGPPVVCYIGRISREKRIDRLVEAAPQVIRAYPDVRFVIAGVAFTRADLAYSQELKQLIGRLGVSDSVDLPGYVEDVPGLLRDCDVLVLPSEREPLGRVMLEAMAAARAVVAYDIGGPGEVIRDGETGILVEPGSVGGLSQAVSRLLGDEHLRKQIGAKARQDVVERFSSRRMAAGIMELYDDILRIAR
jgi:glycosyltransferase involved in cell wall biosynthesis